MRRLLTWCLIALVAASLAGTGRAEAAGPSEQAAQVVVIGVQGLRWQDVTERATPALAQLQREGASGVLSVKTAARADCPAAGWLTLGAGNRVDPAGPEPTPCSAGLPAPTTLPEQVRSNADRREGAVPGALARALQAGGGCISARGGAGAALAAADPTGAVGVQPGPGPCPVLLRAETVTEADALVGSELQARAPSTLLLVIGVSAAVGSDEAHLHVAMALGPGFEKGALRSASTRRAPYVQLVDVAPTVLTALGRPVPQEMIGEPWQASGRAPSLADLRDADLLAQGQRDATVPFFVVLCAVLLLGLGVTTWRRWWRAAEVVGLFGVTALGASYLANLVPWWRTESPLLSLLAVTAAIGAVMTCIALLPRGRLSRAGLACGLVAAVMVLDLLTGSRLQLSSVAGYSPLVAGRFAGIGNVAFGVLAAAALLAAASTRRPALAALTALVVVVDGAPQWGSDVGGVLALVPSYAVLVLLLSGRAASVGRVALATLAGALVVTAFAVADYQRAADERTHLGRFVGQVLDGSAGEVLARKASANLDLLFLSPVNALLPVVVAVLVFVLLRPPRLLRAVFDRTPAWRSGLLAVGTAAGLGFLLNDSGAAVVGLAILVAVPATFAVVARHADLSRRAG